MQRLTTLLVTTLLVATLVHTGVHAQEDCFLKGRAIVNRIFADEVSRLGGAFWEKYEVLGTWLIEDEHVCVTFIRERGRRKVRPLFHTASGRYWFPTDRMIDLFRNNTPWGTDLIAELESLSRQDVRKLKEVAVAWLGVPEKSYILFFGDYSEKSRFLLKKLLPYVNRGEVRVYLFVPDPALACASKDLPERRARIIRTYLEGIPPEATQHRKCQDQVQALLAYTAQKQISFPSFIFASGEVWELDDVETDKQIAIVVVDAIKRAKVLAERISP